MMDCLIMIGGGIIALAIIIACILGMVYLDVQRTAANYEFAQTIGLLPSNDEICGGTK
ncbi:hypothetical protein N6H05_19385 [Sphingobium sp. WTD-1]|uniref:hypothetical protein n=1 Tax=Sphingobium sp. WTD-1 TaxID=2979467 RepID=UPI0024DE06CD|nr:hypothetical protein [Sphingobium sp. WTD-1]WIA55173.1 hypothetical protein N6H05_19385 [Sphingobium sp. WTD-1]